MQIQITMNLDNHLMAFGRALDNKVQFIDNLMDSNENTSFYIIDGSLGGSGFDIVGPPIARTMPDVHNLLAYLQRIIMKRYRRMENYSHLANNGRTIVTNEHPIILIINDIDVLSKSLNKDDLDLLGSLARLGLNAGLTIVSTSTSHKVGLNPEILANLECSVINLDNDMALDLYDHSFLDD